MCSASPWETGRALTFYNTFKDVSDSLGVKLAPPGDRDKEFEPSQKGVVLGVFYDTVNWTWSIRDDKLSIILNKIQDCIEDEVMTLRDIKSLCDQLIDIICLHFEFKFYLGSLIIDASNNGTDLSAKVSL